MTNPKLIALAERAGTKIEERDTTDGHVFDGATIGTYYYKLVYDHKTDSVTPTGQSIRLTDHALLHEIAHFMVAAPEQRDLPEFGLGYVAIYSQEVTPAVVDYEESELQELATQLLCMFFGSRIGISPELPDMSCESWEDYWDLKKLEGTGFGRDAIDRALTAINQLGV